MSQFFVVSESTEDTLDAAEDLQDAIRAAREVAGRGPAGDPVSVLDCGGKAVQQFMRLPDGTVAEQPVVHPAQGSGNGALGRRADPLAAADRSRD